MGFMGPLPSIGQELGNHSSVNFPRNSSLSDMAETWTISVGGRVYGPYALEQMQGFHAENRLADRSLIARAGEEQFRPAVQDPLLAPLFSPAPSIQPINPPSQEPAPEPVTEMPQRAAFGARAESKSGKTGPNHFVIVADIKSGSLTAIEEEVHKLGQAHRFTSQAWVLVSPNALNLVRNALVQKLGKLDKILIVDATHDKAAWFNYGPETDTRVRKMWSRPVEYKGPERRAVRR